jgi:hypothetical protein
LPAGKHTGILTEIQTIVNKKMTKKCTFFGRPHEGGEMLERCLGRGGVGLPLLDNITICDRCHSIEINISLPENTLST